MSKIAIDKDRCKGCELCLFYCPHSLIKMSEKLNKRGIHYAFCKEMERCTGCSCCAWMCPDMAIEVWK